MSKQIDCSNRILWIDNAKALGIILVILGHAIRDSMRTDFVFFDYVYSLIYFFHMPLFFMISGYLLERSFNNKSRKRLLVNKVKSLLIPFFTYSLLIYLVFFLADRFFNVGKMLTDEGMISFPKYVFLMLIGDNPYAFHTWFLISLFIMEAIIIIANAKGGNKIWFMLIIGLFFHLTHLSPVPEGLEYSIHTISIPLQNILFLIVGQLLFIYKRNFNCNKYILILLFAIGVIIFSYDYLFGYVCTIFFKVIGYRFILFIGKLSLISFVLGISAMIKKKKLLQFMGKNSSSIYLFHQPFCCGVLGPILYDILKIPALFVITICFVLSLVLPMAFVNICKKNEQIYLLTSITLNI